MAQRWALGLQYTGTAYAGWQRQKDTPHTIAEQLDNALSFVANTVLHTTCAGRTDAGVHATAQVVHFDTSVNRQARAWILGANSQLPPDISVQWAQPVDASFHARFSARHRRYRYVIYNQAQRPGVFAPYMSWYLAPLDISLMQQAADLLVGEHDFNALRSVHCQAKHARRSIHFLKLQRCGELIVMDVQANGFLHHMVRNIVGVLLAVGAGKQSVEWVGEVLASKDRSQAGVTAPACGLYFTEIGYADEFALPVAHSPFFLSPFLV